MTLTNEQQNLIDNLRAPIKSFRIFALEEVIKSGNSPKLLSVLEEISLLEDDSECSMLISHAISAVRERIEGASKTKEVFKVASHDTFLEKWANSDDNTKMQILSDLPARLPKEIKNLGPELLNNANHVIAARVIRIFSRNWPEDKLNLIVNNLNSSSLVLRLAVLRTLIHIKPELLLNDLPALLSSSDPEVKALAIRGLVKIDKEEALKHLQALLLSPSKTERLAGIQNCPFLPFDMVKPLLLKYFAAETDLELLTKAGWIIEMNPDVEVPFTLFEIAERSPAKKAGLVKNVLNESVKLLEKSGILGNKYIEYTKKLQQWVSKRNALRFVKQIVAKLDEKEVSPEIEKNILIAKKQAIIVETLKEALSWPVSDLVKSRISNYLGITEPNNTKETNVEKTEVSNTPKVPAKNISQLQLLASLNQEKAIDKFNQILLMITHKDSESEIKIAAFQCLTRCRISGAEDVAVKYIKNKDISVATAAVEYLGIVNPDCIFPYLGQCLNISDIGMKSAALGILKNYDFNQAISYLQAMLNSKETTQKRMALECMNQFDFSLVRDILTDFLCRERNESLLESGLCHFAANPSADNVYSLYKIEQAQTEGKIREEAKRLRGSCPEAVNEEVVTSSAAEEPASNENAVSPMSGSVSSNSSSINASSQAVSSEEKQQQTAEISSSSKEEALKERLRQEKEKKASKKPAYAFKSASEGDKPNSKDQLIAIYNLIVETIKSKQLPIAIGILIVLSIFFYLAFGTGGEIAQKPVGRPLVAEVIKREGEVISSLNNIVYMKATDGYTYAFKPLDDSFIVPEKGKLIRVLISCNKGDAEGRRWGHISGMRLINKYSDSKEFLE